MNRRNVREEMIQGAIDLLAPTSQLWEPEATVVCGEVFGQPRQWSLRTDIDNSDEWQPIHEPPPSERGRE